MIMMLYMVSVTCNAVGVDVFCSGFSRRTRDSGGRKQNRHSETGGFMLKERCLTCS